MSSYNNYVFIWPEITKDTPLEKIKHIHQMIWQYVVNTGHKPDTPYAGNCVCCQYTIVHDLECSECPIKWTGKADGRCGNSDSIFQMWNTTKDPIQKRYFAGQIRDMKFKFEVEKEMESKNKIPVTELLVATINKFLNDVHGDSQIRKIRSASNLMVVLYAYMKELGYSDKDILEIINEEVKHPQ